MVDLPASDGPTIGWSDYRVDDAAFHMHTRFIQLEPATIVPCVIIRNISMVKIDVNLIGVGDLPLDPTGYCSC